MFNQTAEEIDLRNLALLKIDEMREEAIVVSYSRLKKELSRNDIVLKWAGDIIWKLEKDGFIKLGENLVVISSKEKARPIIITPKGEEEIEKIKTKIKEK